MLLFCTNSKLRYRYYRCMCSIHTSKRTERLQKKVILFLFCICVFNISFFTSFFLSLLFFIAVVCVNEGTKNQKKKKKMKFIAINWKKKGKEKERKSMKRRQDQKTRGKQNFCFLPKQNNKITIQNSKCFFFSCYLRFYAAVLYLDFFLVLH